MKHECGFNEAHHKWSITLYIYLFIYCCVSIEHKTIENPQEDLLN